MCDDRVAGSVLDCLTEVESAAGGDDDADDTEVSLLSPPPTNASLPGTCSWNVTSLVTTERLARGS